MEDSFHQWKSQTTKKYLMKKVMIIVSIQAALIDPWFPIPSRLSDMNWMEVDLNKSNAPSHFPNSNILQAELIIND